MAHHHHLPARGWRALALGIAAALTLSCMLIEPRTAHATALPAWLVPSGGENWTAGTTHTIEWSGGDPQVTAALYYQTTIVSASVIAAYFPNTGYLSWTIPANIPPGTYTLALAAASSGDVVLSNPITIKPAPECLRNCTLVSASMPACSPWLAVPPQGPCAYTAIAAFGAADALIRTQLSSQCFAGYSIDPNSVVIDYTILPIGTCLSGSSGTFMAEASGYACCCANPVPTQQRTWGSLKSVYR